MNKIHIEYSCFDIDDNLLHMPTKINMINILNGNKVGVSSEEFAEIRNDKDNWKLSDDAFVEFKDIGPRGDNAFIEDMIYTIQKEDFAPSWFQFLNTLKNGFLFSLITARGHKPDTFKRGVEWIIDNYLDINQKEEMYNNLKKFIFLFKGIDSLYKKSPDEILKNKSKEDDFKFEKVDFNNFSKNEIVKNYLNECGFYGVSYDGFIEKNKSGGAESPEIGKEIALREFKQKVKSYADKIGASISFGMSDDDMKNIIHIEKVFKELKEIYPETIFRLYDTSKRGYVKKIIESKIKNFKNFIIFQEASAGVINSLPNAAMSGGMNSQNPFETNKIQQSNFLTKLSKEIFKNLKENDNKERKNKYIKKNK